METIKGLVEAVEEKDDFAGSIVARDESLALYASVPGLGPPDLCWLQKAAKGTWTAAAEPRGFFHYCLGRDVSSSAAIAAYFAELNAKVDTITLMQGLWYNSETQIQRGFYCCYDPFQRLDIRCELCIPGGVVCGALDADGTVHEVTAEMWRNCAVAAFLRHQLMDPDLTSHAHTVHRWQPVVGSDAESRLLSAVLEMYTTGLLPQALEMVTADTARGCVAEHMDLVLYTVYQYFGARHRWQVALDFFLQLQQVHLNAAVYVAAVQRELDSFDDSFATLSAAVEANPQEPCLLLSLANECMYADQVDMAAKMARRAVRIKSHLRPAWLLLARCYIRQGLYSLALVTLNVVPPPPMPMQEQELLFGVPAAAPKYLTKPSVTRYDPDMTVAKQMNVEEVAADGSRSLLYLPAAVMVPREPLDLGPWPDLGPSRSTRAVLSAAYGLFQELVAAIGWDSFLEMRARVFVMQNEAARKSGSPEKFPASNPAVPAYEQALEELAAIGLSEHPEELRAAREANLRAEQLQREEEEEAAAVARLAAGEAAAAGAAAAAGPGGSAAVTAGTPVVAAAAKGPVAAAAGAAVGVGAVTGAQLRAGAALVGDDGEVPAAPAANGVAAAPTSGEGSAGAGGEAGGAAAQQNGQGAGEVVARVEKPPHDGLVPVNSLPMGMFAGGTSSLWSMMFGVQKSQAPRSELDEHQVARLQQYGSVRRPDGAPGPVAESRGTHATHGACVSHSTAEPQVSHAGCVSSHGRTRVQCNRDSPQGVVEGWLDVNPWQAQSGPPPWLEAQHSTTGREASGWAGSQATGAARSGPCQASGLSERQLRGVARWLQALIRRKTHTSPELSTRSCNANASMVRASTVLTSASTARPCTASASTASVSGRPPLSGIQSVSDRPAAGAPSRISTSTLRGPVCEARETHATHAYYSSDSDDWASDDEVSGDGDYRGGYRAGAMQQHAQRQRAGSRAAAVNGGGGVGGRHQHHLPQQYGGGALSHTEADREFVLLGAAAVEEEQQSKAKRLCVRWLDELIIALWHDLQAYMEWKAVDADLQDKLGNTLAGFTLGLGALQSESAAADPEAAASLSRRPSSVPPLPAGDWMRRGLLAERLYHDAEALLAYRCCLASGPFNLIAAHAVMRLAAEAGDARLALQTCLQALSWHSSQLVATSQPAFPPTAATCCVGHVASLLDKAALQALLDQLMLGEEGVLIADTVKSWMRQMLTAAGVQAAV